MERLVTSENVQETSGQLATAKKIAITELISRKVTKREKGSENA